MERDRRMRARFASGVSPKAAEAADDEKVVMAVEEEEEDDEEEEEEVADKTGVEYEEVGVGREDCCMTMRLACSGEIGRLKSVREIHLYSARYKRLLRQCKRAVANVSLSSCLMQARRERARASEDTNVTCAQDCVCARVLLCRLRVFRWKKQILVGLVGTHGRRTVVQRWNGRRAG